MVFPRRTKKGQEESKPKREPKRVLTCPECGSTDLYYETGLITGYSYHCKECGYIGAFVIEKEENDVERKIEKDEKT